MKARPGRQPVKPEPPKEKLYKVVGSHPVHGVKPGDTVRLALSEAREKSLVQAGALEPVKPEKPAKKKEKDQNG